MNQSQQKIGRAVFETLENRRLLASAVTFADGVLTLNGNAQGTNKLYVWPDSHGLVWGLVNNSGTSAPASAIRSIRIIGGSGNDEIKVYPDVATPVYIQAGDGNDTIIAGAAAAVIDAGPGNDVVLGSPGNDSVHGGDGRDSVVGNGGNDSLWGDDGDDTLTSGNGDDYLDGGAGSNTLTPGGGRNVIPGVAPQGTPTTPPPPAAPSTPPPVVDPMLPRGVIGILSTSIVAGQAIYVQAMDSVLKAGTPISAKYEWNFGDTAARFDNLVGFNAAHIYDRPGVYVITLRLTNELGKQSSATVQVTVAADMRRAIYVDAVRGSDANTGGTQSTAVRTAARAEQLITDDTRILFSRGQVFNLADSISIRASNVTIGAYGAGADPILLYTGAPGAGHTFIDTADSSHDVVIQNLTFDTSSRVDDGMPDSVFARGAAIAVRACTFLNVGDAVNTAGAPHGVLIQDNVEPLVDGMRAYFVWLASSDTTIIGNYAPNSTRQHIVRGSGDFTRVLISDNLFSNLDRRNQGDPWDYSKATINLQRGSYAYVRNNTVSDGDVRTGPLGDADGKNNNPTGYQLERTSWVVWEGNTINNTQFQVKHGSEHVAFRNNVVRMNDNVAITIDGYDSTYNRRVSDLVITNNTAYNAGATGGFVRLWGPASGIAMTGNLYIATSLVTGSYSTAPVYIGQDDTSSFTNIAGNLWPVPALRTWWANNGINVVSGSDEHMGYKDENTWDTVAGVSNDVFMNVTPGRGYQYLLSGIAYGADLSKIG